MQRVGRLHFDGLATIFSRQIQNSRAVLYVRVADKMQNASSSFSTAEFRAAMSTFATGVTVVTTRAGEVLHGLTVNAFCSLSLTPPLVLICVDKNAQSHDFIIAGRCFAVNVLGAAQQELSKRFAQNNLDGNARFAGVAHTQAATGAPILAHVISWLDCKLIATHEGGDHSIFVGEVVALGHGEESDPLLYFQSRYQKLEH